MRGKTVNEKIIDTAWKAAFPALAKDTQWIILSDHCINHTNKGACKCTKTELWEVEVPEKSSRCYFRV